MDGVQPSKALASSLSESIEDIVAGNESGSGEGVQAIGTGGELSASSSAPIRYPASLRWIKPAPGSNICPLASAREAKYLTTDCAQGYGAEVYAQNTGDRFTWHWWRPVSDATGEPTGQYELDWSPYIEYLDKSQCPAEWDHNCWRWSSGNYVDWPYPSGIFAYTYSMIDDGFYLGDSRYPGPWRITITYNPDGVIYAETTHYLLTFVVSNFTVTPSTPTVGTDQTSIYVKWSTRPPSWADQVNLSIDAVNRQGTVHSITGATLPEWNVEWDLRDAAGYLIPYGDYSLKLVPHWGDAQPPNPREATVTAPAPTDHYLQADLSGQDGLSVNPTLGNFILNAVDVSIPGPDQSGMYISRSYNSRGAGDPTGILGPGWSWSYGRRVDIGTDGSATVLRPDGSRNYYRPTAGGFRSQGGVYDDLRRNADGTFTLSRQDHTIESYDTDGRLTQVSDRSGNSVQIDYDGNGKPSAIRDNAGRSLTLSYNASGQLASITDPIGRTVRYGYDAAGRLTEVWDLADRHTVLGYAGGLLSRVVDPRGNSAVSIDYDASGRVTAQTDALGHMFRFSYDTMLQTTTVTNPRGAQTQYKYDSQFRLLDITDPAGTQRVSYYLDEVASFINRGGSVTRLVQDERGNLTMAVDPYFHSYRYAYQNDNLTQVTDPLGGVTLISYDYAHRPVRMEEYVVSPYLVTTFTYDSNGNLIRFTNPRGHPTTMGYDSYGNLTSVQSSGDPPSTMTYDLAGRMTSSTDPRGNAAGADQARFTTTFTYTDADEVATVRNGLGQETRYEYDAAGNLTAVTDPLLRTASYIYDARNQPVRAVDAIGQETHYDYDAAGNLRSVTDPLGATTQYEFDLANRRTATVDALGGAERYDYDPNANITRVVDRNGNAILYEYDALDRMVRETYPVLTVDGTTYSNVTTELTYDVLGNLSTRRDALGNAISFAYDGLSRLTRVTDALGNETAYAYDANGNRVRVTDANGHTSTYVFDQQDRLTREINPLGKIWEYSYDAAGNRTSRLDPNGQLVTYAFDPLDQLEQVSYPDGTRVTHTYDAAGRRTLLENRDNSQVRFEYDNLDRLVRVVDNFNRSVGYAYDADGNRTQVTYPDNKSASYGYDVLNRLVSIIDREGELTYLCYDTGSRLTRQNLPNGVLVGYTYNEANWVSRITNIRPGKPERELRTVAYTQDKVGNRVKSVEKAWKCEDEACTETTPTDTGGSSGGSKAGDGFTEDPIDSGTTSVGDGSTISSTDLTTTSAMSLDSAELTTAASTSTSCDLLPSGGGGGGKVTQFTYDAVYRLVSAKYPQNTVYSWTYDKVGNRLSQTDDNDTRNYHYNGANQLTHYEINQARTAPETISMEYDANGNTLRHGTTTYTYDADNRLQQVRHENGTFTYAYDGDGIRTKESGPTQTSLFLIDRAASPYQHLAEYSPTGSPIRVYVVGDRLVTQTSDATKSYFHEDGLASTVTLTAADGQIQAQYAYEAFGRLRQSSIGNMGITPFKYTGEHYNLTTQLVFLRARYYDPALGRFISQDPFKGSPFQPATQHPYAYAANNPMTYVDRTGQYLESAWDVASLLMSIAECSVDPTFLSCGAVLVDAAAVALPVPGGAGAALKAAKAGSKVSKAVKATTSATTAGKAVKATVKSGKAIKKAKPMQFHHYATNKHRTFTAQFDNIARKYDLRLDAD